MLKNFFLKVKNQPKKDKFEVPPQGVDQLLHVNQLWGVDKTTFFCSFSDVFVDFSREITEKALKWTKKVEKRMKKGFEQLLGVRSTQELVEIHNTGGTRHLIWMRIGSSSSWRPPLQFDIKKFVKFQGPFSDLLFRHHIIVSSKSKSKNNVGHQSCVVYFDQFMHGISQCLHKSEGGTQFGVTRSYH